MEGKEENGGRRGDSKEGRRQETNRRLVSPSALDWHIRQLKSQFFFFLCVLAPFQKLSLSALTRLKIKLENYDFAKLFTAATNKVTPILLLVLALSHIKFT